LITKGKGAQDLHDKKSSEASNKGDLGDKENVGDARGREAGEQEKRKRQKQEARKWTYREGARERRYGKGEGGQRREIGRERNLIICV